MLPRQPVRRAVRRWRRRRSLGYGRHRDWISPLLLLGVVVLVVLFFFR